MNKVTRNIEDIDNITEYTRKLAIKEKKLKKRSNMYEKFFDKKIEKVYGKGIRSKKYI